MNDVHPARARLRSPVGLALASMPAGQRQRRGRTRFFALGVAGALFSFAPFGQAELRRAPIDQEELDKMEAANPHAVGLLEQGETLASAGKLPEADALFQQGLAEYKASPLLERRRCEVLTAMGRRREASAACYRALQGVRSNPNLRATVRALATGPLPPTWADEELALDLVNKERNRAPGQLTPVAALCDLAASLGDGIMLQHCATDLQRIAPDAAETRRATALLSAGCPPWRFWTAWGALAAAVWLTLGHALWRWARRKSGRRTPATAAVLGLALWALPGTAQAQMADAGARMGMLSKWAINDDDPEKSIPPKKDLDADPIQAGYFLQDLIFRAEVYSKHGQHETAAKLYRALARAVPERATAFTKMCKEYEAMGDLEKAIVSCQAALLRDGVLVQDYEHYVHLVLASPVISDKRQKELAMVLDHMNKDPAGLAVVNELECEVGMRTQNKEQLEDCTSKLRMTAPTSPKTISYEWALAMVRGKLDQAKDWIEQARAAGVDPKGLERMQNALNEAQAGRDRVKGILINVAVVLLLAGLGVLAALMAMRRKATPQGA